MLCVNNINKCIDILPITLAHYKNLIGQLILVGTAKVCIAKFKFFKYNKILQNM